MIPVFFGDKLIGILNIPWPEEWRRALYGGQTRLIEARRPAPGANPATVMPVTTLPVFNHAKEIIALEVVDRTGPDALQSWPEFWEMPTPIRKGYY